jgi:hypothetical protein
MLVNALPEWLADILDDHVVPTLDSSQYIHWGNQFPLQWQKT